MRFFVKTVYNVYKAAKAAYRVTVIRIGFSAAHETDNRRIPSSCRSYRARRRPASTRAGRAAHSRARTDRSRPPRALWAGRFRDASGGTLNMLALRRPQLTPAISTFTQACGLDSIHGETRWPHHPHRSRAGDRRGPVELASKHSRRRPQRKVAHELCEALGRFQVEPVVVSIEGDILAVGDELADGARALDWEATAVRAVQIEAGPADAAKYWSPVPRPARHANRRMLT